MPSIDWSMCSNVLPYTYKFGGFINTYPHQTDPSNILVKLLLEQEKIGIILNWN